MRSQIFFSAPRLLSAVVFCDENYMIDTRLFALQTFQAWIHCIFVYIVQHARHMVITITGP